MKDLIGLDLGDFVIQSSLGHGGMAHVFLAQQKSVNREVALKLIDIQQDLKHDTAFRQRFANEAQFIAQLEHLHIVPIYAYGIHDQYAYIAMRLMRGGTLRELLEEQGRLSYAQIAKLFGQMGQGLAYAHSQGLIHRDLKPANIMLDSNNNAYLSDFGLAKLTTSEENLTQSDSVIGTLAYMSPEQLRGEQLDHRSDIYALGVVLYQLITGVVPFRQSEADNMVGVIYKHLQVIPQAPSVLRQDIPDALNEITMKALAKDPSKRFQTVGEMVTAITQSLDPNQTEGIAFPSPQIPLVAQLNQSTRLVNQTDSVPETSRTSMIISLTVMISVVIMGIAIMILASQSEVSNQAPSYTILEGESQLWDEWTPNTNQIELARQALGQDGFIAYVACSRDSEYHATLTREIATFTRNYDLPIQIYDGEGDAYNQRIQIESALADGARAFIICPLELPVIAESLVAIQDAGLPLVSTAGANDTYGGVITSNETSDYIMGETVGRLAGEIIADEYNGRASVLILDFPSLDSIVERADGIEEGVLATAPNATIIGRRIGGTTENGFNSVQELLEERSAPDIIASINDAGAYGAIDALDEAEYPPDSVVIVSIDAEQRALDYIRDGYYMRGTLTVGRRELARSVVDAIVQMLAGSRIPQIITIPPGGMITQENLPDLD